MNAQWVVSVSYGELILKGKNRRQFTKAALRHLRKALAGIPVQAQFEQFGKVFLAVDEADVERTVAAARRVFGLIYVTPSLQVPRDEAALREAAAALLSHRVATLREQDGADSRIGDAGTSDGGTSRNAVMTGSPDAAHTVTFKVDVKRSDKSFAVPSPEFAARVGSWMLEDVPGLAVEMHAPDITLRVEIREDFFVSVDRYAGMGGLPAGSGGRGLLLLSGGIDSPAAGFALARRGLSLSAVHFHSYPFTSERAQDKARRLAAQMERTVGPMRLFMVNLTDIYTAIARHCSKRNTTVLSRRMMMRIADRIADQDHDDCLITGESLGQVASQTIQGISVVNEAARHPILRPFIATDKTAIIDIARDIGTFDISIEPFDDCCSIFAPEHPNTRPSLAEIERDEAKLDVEGLVAQALETLERVDIESP